jgi:hypothetical protein
MSSIKNVGALMKSLERRPARRPNSWEDLCGCWHTVRWDCGTVYFETLYLAADQAAGGGLVEAALCVLSGVRDTEVGGSHKVLVENQVWVDHATSFPFGLTVRGKPDKTSAKDTIRTLDKSLWHERSFSCGVSASSAF